MFEGVQKVGEEKWGLGKRVVLKLKSRSKSDCPELSTLYFKVMPLILLHYCSPCIASAVGAFEDVSPHMSSHLQLSE